jgi:integrase
MGWIKEYKGGDGKTLYYAVYRDLQGRERSAGAFTRKGDAKKAWQDAESDLRAGKRIGDPKLGRQKLRPYVEDTWFPHHPIEASTRETYTYLLNRYILDQFGNMRMREILPAHVRAWILELQRDDVGAATIRKCKLILDAIFTTALNDQITVLHPGRGVKTPPVPQQPKRIITAEQFDRIHAALLDETMQLLVETDIESGLRWGELTELRVKDLDRSTGILTVSRVVIHLKAKDRPGGTRFVVKQYPKDQEWRQVKLATHLVAKLEARIIAHGLRSDDLLFEMPEAQSARRTRPAELPDPDTLGLTEPNDKGRHYRHGTLSAYQLGRCRCRHCKDAIAAYRAERRARGKDAPRPTRTVATDGHISGDWFRKSIWAKALEQADIGFHITPHGLRHAHASWLLAGGADLQAVKERLGHGSIRTTEGYLHALPGAQDAALTALDAVRGNRDEAKTDQAATQDQPGGTEAGADGRDEELAQLRGMVAKFKEILGPLGDTA